MAPTETAREGLFGFISRRRLLQIGLGAGSLLAMGGGGGILWLRRGAPHVDGLSALSDQEYRTLRAIARAHLPAGGPFAVGADDLGLARAFDRYLSDEPEQNVRDLKSALFLVELGPLLFERRFQSFSRLEPPDQEAHWRGWMTSELLLRRQISLAFRKFMSLVFFDQEKVWPHIGYPGPMDLGGSR